jgi:mono/diheme cytochrome c family protein
MPQPKIIRLSGFGGDAYAALRLAAPLFTCSPQTEGVQMSRYSRSCSFGLPLLLLAGLCFATPATSSEVDAAGYYKLRCASCHGANGEGTRHKSPSLGPPLRGNPLVINAPAEMLANIIRHGRNGQQRVYDDAYPNMPAFDAGMVPDVIGLANYLKTVLQQAAAANEGVHPKGVSQ